MKGASGGAAKPDVFDLEKDQTTTPETPCPTPYE